VESGFWNEPCRISSKCRETLEEWWKGESATALEYERKYSAEVKRYFGKESD
jgi:hypothetical protein